MTSIEQRLSWLEGELKELKARLEAQPSDPIAKLLLNERSVVLRRVEALHSRVAELEEGQRVLEMKLSAVETATLRLTPMERVLDGIAATLALVLARMPKAND